MSFVLSGRGRWAEDYFRFSVVADGRQAQAGKHKEVAPHAAYLSERMANGVMLRVGSVLRNS